MYCKLFRITIFLSTFQTLDMFRKQLYWLKREDSNITLVTEETEIPDEFLCPITHEIMREPVKCSGTVYLNYFDIK